MVFCHCAMIFFVVSWFCDLVLSLDNSADVRLLHCRRRQSLLGPIALITSIQIFFHFSVLFPDRLFLNLRCINRLLCPWLFNSANQVCDAHLHHFANKLCKRFMRDTEWSWSNWMRSIQALWLEWPGIWAMDILNTSWKIIEKSRQH